MKALIDRLCLKWLDRRGWVCANRAEVQALADKVRDDMWNAEYAKIMFGWEPDGTIRSAHAADTPAANGG